MHGVEGVDLTNVAEDDPPFRTMGHPCLSQLICYTTDTGVKITGRVVGFLSEDNTDSKGGPVYVNDKGVPAKLFHIELSSPFCNIELEKHELDQSEITDERRCVCLCSGKRKADSFFNVFWSGG